MFMRIFVNLMLAPAALGGLYIVFTGSDYRARHGGLCLFVGLVTCNLNWCRKHLWHRSKPKYDDSFEDFYRSKSVGNLDDVEVPKVGNTLKRGVDLRK